MVGDDVLQHALAAYRPGADVNPAYFQGLLEEGRKRDLEWFFDDWVYRNRGLPEFRVDNVYARPMLEEPSQIYLVTVTIENRRRRRRRSSSHDPNSFGREDRASVGQGASEGFRQVTSSGRSHQVVVNDGSVPEINSGNNTFDVPANPAP